MDEVKFISKVYRSGKKLYIYVPSSVAPLIDTRRKYKVILQPIE